MDMVSGILLTSSALERKLKTRGAYQKKECYFILFWFAWRAQCWGANFGTRWKHHRNSTRAQPYEGNTLLDGHGDQHVAHVKHLRKIGEDAYKREKRGVNSNINSTLLEPRIVNEEGVQNRRQQKVTKPSLMGPPNRHSKISSQNFSLFPETFVFPTYCHICHSM